jgi:hypothetical protein
VTVFAARARIAEATMASRLSQAALVGYEGGNAVGYEAGNGGK